MNHGPECYTDHLLKWCWFRDGQCDDLLWDFHHLTYYIPEICWREQLGEYKCLSFSKGRNLNTLQLMMMSLVEDQRNVY